MDKNWDFYKGKKILITGNTGFKGSWMSSLLLEAGADVTGYSLEAPTEPSMFELCGLKHEMRTVYGDIRDLSARNVSSNIVHHAIFVSANARHMY